jgi:hypothetical protein
MGHVRMQWAAFEVPSWRKKEFNTSFSLTLTHRYNSLQLYLLLAIEIASEKKTKQKQVKVGQFKEPQPGR